MNVLGSRFPTYAIEQIGDKVIRLNLLRSEFLQEEGVKDFQRAPAMLLISFALGSEGATGRSVRFEMP